MSDIKLEALDSVDDNWLSLVMADIKVVACTWETTTPSSSSLATEDIKQEPLADGYSKQLSSDKIKLKYTNNTNQTSVFSLLPTTDVKSESLEANFNEHSSTDSVNLQGDNVMGETEKISSFHMTDVKCEALENDLNKQLSSHSINQQGESFMDKTGRISSFPTTDIKCEPIEADLNEQSSTHSVNPLGDNLMDKTERISSFHMGDVKCEPLIDDLNELTSSHTINLKGDNLMDKTGKISPLFPTTGFKHEPLEVGSNEQLSFSDVSPKGDNCTVKARSLLLPVADVKIEPLADKINEQFSSDCFVLKENNSTVRSLLSSSPKVLEYRRKTSVASASELSQKQGIRLKDTETSLFPSPNMLDCKRITGEVVDPKLARFPSRKVLYYRRKENVSDSKLSQSKAIHAYGTSQTQLCLPEVLTIIALTKENDAELAKKKKFMDVSGTAYILDHIDTIEKEINIKKVHSNEEESLSMDNNTKEYDKDKHFPDGQSNTDLNKCFVANGELSSETQLLHDKNRKLNDENNKFNNAENKINDCNDKESQKAVTRIKRKKKEKTGKREGKVQGKAPTLNQYQNNICDLKRTTSTHLHHDHSYAFNKNRMVGANRSNIEERKNILEKQGKEEMLKTMEEKRIHEGKNILEKQGNDEMLKIMVEKRIHEAKYILVKIGKEEMLKIMEEKRIHEGKNILQKKGKEEMLKIIEENRISEGKNILEKKEKEEMLKIMVKKRIHEWKPILPKKGKEEMLKIMEEKRITKKKHFPDLLCSICGKMIRGSMSRHMFIHHPIDSFLCKFCGMLFQNRKEVSRHEKINHYVVPECDICHKTFSSKYAMLKHRNRIHINKWKLTFLCTICGKKFPSSYLLKLHASRHSDKPFKCRFCDAKFTKTSYLSTHKRNYHKAEKVSGCDIRYHRKNSLQRHGQSHQKCKTATSTMHTIQTGSKEDAILLQPVPKEESAGKR